MNQILDFSQDNRPSGNGGSDNVVRVFAIILILFAIALIGVVAYGMFFNKQERSKAEQDMSNANITVDIDGTQAIIKVSHNKNIKKMVYSWNTSSERTKNVTDQKEIEEKIDIPAGDNTLHIKVTDENNVETTFDKEISSEQGVDILNPVIELSVTEEKKLKIVATDETAMDFVTYRWNKEDEQTMYANEGSKKIDFEIDILKGENDLTVVAVDGSSNTTTEAKSFTGLTKPEIKVTLSEDGSSIDIKATHENGIQKVTFKFNGEDYNIDIGNKNPKEIQFAKDLEVGDNRIVVKVKSVDGTETTFDANCTYGNSGESRITQNNSSNSGENNDETSEQRENNNTNEINE